MRQLFSDIKKTIKGQSFITGAMTLAVAGIICRVIGLAFRIPLANIVGNYGMGLYQMVFPLYALLLIVSSAGIPIAISKMVAKTMVDKEKAETTPSRILLNSLILLGFIGLIVSGLFLIFAHQIAALQGNAAVGKIYLAIAPAVFFVCLISAFRGYFQGLSNMIPTATSQIIEQIVKVSVALGLALALAPRGVDWAVLGAILAITISEVVALVYLIIVYFFHRQKTVKNWKLEPKDKRWVSFPLMWLVLKKSIPITLMSAIFPLILVFDSMVVINMLQAGGASNQVATQLYGISSGTVHTLINMPAVLGVAIGTAVVPMTATLIKKGNTPELQQKAALAIKLTLVISLFFALFYMAFSKQIIVLLYEKAFRDHPDQLTIATRLLKIEATMILLMGLSQVFTSLLQGADKAKFPLAALAAGGVVKIVFQLVFIRTPLGIYSVSIGNMLMFAIAFTLNTIFITKKLKTKPIRIKKDVWRLIVLTVIYVGVLVGLVHLMPSGKWWILLSGTIAFTVYVLAVWLLRIFYKPLPPVT